MTVGTKKSVEFPRKLYGQRTSQNGDQNIVQEPKTTHWLPGIPVPHPISRKPTSTSAGHQCPLTTGHWCTSASAIFQKPKTHRCSNSVGHQYPLVTRHQYSASRHWSLKGINRILLGFLTDLIDGTCFRNSKPKVTLETPDLLTILRRSNLKSEGRQEKRGSSHQQYVFLYFPSFSSSRSSLLYPKGRTSYQANQEGGYNFQHHQETLLLCLTFNKTMIPLANKLLSSCFIFFLTIHTMIVSNHQWAKG